MDIDIQDWNGDRVLNKPLSSLERGNDDQRRTGRSLFLSFFWFLSCNGVDRYHDIQQIAIILWNAFDDERKSHLEARAILLNERPVPGLLPVWPEEDLRILNLQEIVLQSLKKEMNYFAKSVRNAIQVVLKGRLTKTVRFGLQHVKVAAQEYCGKNNPLPVNKLLSRILFGENYCKMEQYTIYETDRVSLFAIPSLEQAKNIFTIADDCATKLYIKNNVNNNNNNNNNIV